MANNIICDMTMVLSFVKCYTKCGTGEASDVAQVIVVLERHE